MRLVVLGLCILAFALSGRSVRAGNLLISADEAALPPASDATRIPALTRAITRRPDLILASPSGSVHSPFDLQFKFQTHGSSGIKPESFHLIYLKKPGMLIAIALIDKVPVLPDNSRPLLPSASPAFAAPCN